MVFIRILTLVLLFTAFLPLTVFAEERQHILSFADALFEEGDHYRAITEYKRFLHLFPNDNDAPRAALNIAESFLAGRRWDEAAKALERVQQDYPESSEASRAALLEAEVPFRQGDFKTAEQRFRQISENSPAPVSRREARYRLAWTLIEEDRYASAAGELSHLDEAHAEGLRAEMPMMDRLRLKSPRLAGGLSATLPGSGQLYAGRPRDAALAFLLNAAFLAGAWEAFDSGNEAVGGILLFFEVGWYTGNIYNAANSAHKYNRDLREEEKRRLRERFGTTLSLREGLPMMGVNLRF